MDQGSDSPTEQELERRWRRRSRPDNEIPASVAFDAVLAESDALAIFLSGLRVYTTGVEFVLDIRARTADPDDDEAYVGRLLHGHRGDALLLGVEFSDGRTGSNVRAPRTMSTDEDAPVLNSGGGGGDSRAADASYFLSPLPPPGDLTLVCALPARDIAETVVPLPTAAILEAASRARILWPWEPERQRERRRERPDLPSGGWFAEHNDL